MEPWRRWPLDQSGADGIGGSAILAAKWWAVVLRGVFSLLVGLLAFITPIATMVALVWLFGAYALVSGLFNLLAAWRRSGRNPWWMLVLSGLAGIAAGAVSFGWPGITAVAFVYVVAAWALMTGVLEVWAAISLRKELTGEWLLALAGLFSIVFALLLAINPTVGVVTLVWLLGAYALVFGVVTIALGLRLRKRRETQRHERLAA